MVNDLEQWMHSASRQISTLRFICIGQFIVIIAVTASLWLPNSVQANPRSDVLRVRGLVIEDAQGKPRILLGAPFPSVAGRKRQEEGSAAMLFLSQDGTDRLLVGEGIGAQIAGKVYPREKRAVIGSAYGVTIMDGDGNERGGFGFTALPSGGGRAVVSLDRPVGDAWGAVVDDKTGWAGMVFDYPMPIGEYQPGIEMGVMGERPFLHFKDKSDNSRAEISLAPTGAPSLTVSDEKGKQLADLFRTVR